MPLALGKGVSTFIYSDLNGLNASDGLFAESGRNRIRFPDRLARSRIRHERNVSETGVLRDAGTQETIILKKNHNMKAIETGSGSGSHPRCVAAGMFMPVRQISEDISRLEKELEAICSRLGKAPAPGGETNRAGDAEYCFRLLDHLSYHAKILRELAESIAAGKWTIPSEGPSSDLNGIVTHWINRMKGDESYDSRARITLKLNRDIPGVAMRASELFQIVYHLVGNAIESLSSLSDGEITIKTGTSGNNLLLEVMDNGYGMTKEARDKAFDPGYPAGREGKEDGRRTGLGLYTARMIVEEYGGRIDLQSEKGIGTVLSVFLPIDKNAKRSSGSDGNGMAESPPAPDETRIVPEPSS
jgi:signal transduction histidine kinase